MAHALVFSPLVVKTFYNSTLKRLMSCPRLLCMGSRREAQYWFMASVTSAAAHRFTYNKTPESAIEAIPVRRYLHLWSGKDVTSYFIS